MSKRNAFDALDPEILDRVVSRRDAFRKAGNVAGAMALASMPVAFAVMAKDAFAQGMPADVTGVLNFALTLEYLEDEFYRTGLETSGLIAAENVPVFQQISKHETSHVALLQSALGAGAVPKPTFDFTAGGAFDPFGDPVQFLALAQGFEDTGVRAYKGQAGNLISDGATLTTALRIHSVEARHASEVRRIRGFKGWITNAEVDVPALAAVYAGEDNRTQAGVDISGLGTAAAVSEAFDEPLTQDEVLAIAGQFIVA